jgi:hypothetical protein
MNAPINGLTACRRGSKNHQPIPDGNQMKRMLRSQDYSFKDPQAFVLAALPSDLGACKTKCCQSTPPEKPERCHQQAKH